MYPRRTLMALNRVSDMTVAGGNRAPMRTPRIVLPSQKDHLKNVLTSSEIDTGSNFTLKKIYSLFLADFQRLWPNNKDMKATIRATLQKLRDEEFIFFKGRGVYSMRPEEHTPLPPTHITKDYEPHRCEARIMDKKSPGYFQKDGCVHIPDNVRCGHMKRIGCGYLCLKHSNMFDIGQMWMGKITEKRPELEKDECQPTHLKNKKYPYRWS